MMTRIIILSIILLSSASVFSQKRIILKNKKTAKEIVIPINTRIGYLTKGAFSSKKGNLNFISDSTINVRQNNIQLNNLKFIGNIKKGTGLKVTLLSVASGWLLGQTLFSSYSSKIKTTSLIGSVALFSFSIHISEKNKLRNVKKKWQINVE